MTHRCNRSAHARRTCAWKSSSAFAAKVADLCSGHPCSRDRAPQLFNASPVAVRCRPDDGGAWGTAVQGTRGRRWGRHGDGRGREGLHGSERPGPAGLVRATDRAHRRSAQGGPPETCAPGPTGGLPRPPPRPRPTQQPAGV